MAYYTKEQIEQVRQIELLTYLQRYEPTELIRIRGDTYCTKEHDSLKISNGNQNIKRAYQVMQNQYVMLTVNNLSNFIFSLIRAIGLILLGLGIMQVGLSLKSHDTSQRANGFLTLADGIIITFTKEILNMIAG